MKVRVLVLLLLIHFLYFCPRHASSTHAEPIRGIILISLDTLRADHLGAYGYHRNTSPAIDAFAKENILFERAFVQAPHTLPSHMSIMTSLYPSFHGVWKNDSRLADEHVTLAELLKENGYQTAAFVDGGYVSAAFGFTQGFDSYDDQGGGIAQILPKAEKWLDENKSNQFFLFIHCFDIHSPYNPPPPYDRIFHDFSYTGHLTPSNKDMEAINKGKLKMSDEDLRHFIALYDGGIRYTDEKIGQFFSYLKDSGVYDQSLIIITSDHGEAFKEHGFLLHWQIYHRPNLHVPLIMHIPRYPKKEIRVNELAQSIDLLPTILKIAGIPPHKKAQGKNLVPLTTRHKNFLYRFLWHVSRLFKRESKTSFAEYFRYNYSIITDDYQMLYNTIKSPSFQLFDIKSDPYAKNDIAQDHDDTIQQLFSRYEELYRTAPAQSMTTTTIIFDEKTREQLKALGYLIE